MGQTTESEGFDEVNNRTMDYSDRSGTLQSVVVVQHPKTDIGFYKPNLSGSGHSNKSYLQATGNINVDLGGFDENEGELPST